MEEIQLSKFHENIHSIIDSIVHSQRSILVSNNGKALVKVVPISSEKKSWLGCMRNKGKITGDIISTVDELKNWKVFSE